MSVCKRWKEELSWDNILYPEDVTTENGWQIIRKKVRFRKPVRRCVGDFWGDSWRNPMSKDKSRFSPENPKWDHELKDFKVESN